MAEGDDEDNIPILEDVLRPGNARSGTGEARNNSGNETESTLTDAEIEAIASRVVERHTRRMEEAIARAIQQAIDMKARMAKKSGEDRG